MNTISVQGGKCVESRTLLSGIYFDIFHENMKLTKKFTIESLEKDFREINSKLNENKFVSVNEFQKEFSEVANSFKEKHKVPKKGTEKKKRK